MIKSAGMPLQPGQSLFKGKYAIDALISSGANTTLYRTQPTPQQAARLLRVVQRKSSGNGTAVFNEYLRRFQTEMSLSRMFIHPNILRVHVLDKDANTLVLVTDWADGGSLSERLQALAQINRRMSIDDSICVIQEVADGLAVIHAENIVHRNIKPSKVLFDANGHAKLADLGLAQLPGEPVTRLKLRQSRMPHPGTPAYMSPEQKTLSDYISPASDVFSLGLILFEMLTGRVYRNMRPGVIASKLRADIPAWLDKLLARMLDEDARRRPWDAGEVAKLLRDRSASSLPRPHMIGAATDAGAMAMPVMIPLIEGTPQFTAIDGNTKAAPAQKPVADLSGDSEQRQSPHRRSGCALLLVILLCAILGLGSVVFISSAGWNYGPFMAMTDAASTVEFQSLTVEPTRPRLKITPSSAPALPTEAPAEINTSLIATSTQAPALVLSPAPGVTIELVRVPAGAFVMGSSDADPHSEPNEKPQHTVNLAEFYIAKFDMTNQQFAVFVQTTGYSPTAWLAAKTTGKQNHPASPISWEDANAFCLWVSKVTRRLVLLPTEAQWEKAARGADGRLYPWGSAAPSGALLNFDMLIKDTSPVGKFSPRGDSPYGVADMAGNVWEWTNTLYSDPQGQPYRYPYSPQDGRELPSPTVPTYRVLRGGSYLNDGDYVRSAFRGADDSAHAQKGYGFRIVVLP